MVVKTLLGNGGIWGVVSGWRAIYRWDGIFISYVDCLFRAGRDAAVKVIEGGANITGRLF